MIKKSILQTKAFKHGIRWAVAYLQCQNKLNKPIEIETEVMKEVIERYKQGY